MVVIDSSALIPLSRVGKLSLISEVYGEVFTTSHVYKETVKEGKPGTAKIKKAFDQWIETSHLNEEEAQKIAKLEGIEKADVAVILLAEEKNEVLLANDKGLIELARTRAITSHWVTTLLLLALKKGKIDKEECEDILYQLVERGMNLKPTVYAQLLKKIKTL